MSKQAVFCYRLNDMSLEWANRLFVSNGSAVKRIVIDPDTPDDGNRHDGSLAKQRPVVRYRMQAVETPNG